FAASAPHPPTPTLFPYTTLFRSESSDSPQGHGEHPKARHEARARTPARPVGSRDPGLAMPHPAPGLAGPRVSTMEGRRLRRWGRSEEHTSELQSLTNLVCRLLLE